MDNLNKYSEEEYSFSDNSESEFLNIQPLYTVLNYREKYRQTIIINTIVIELNYN